MLQYYMTLEQALADTKEHAGNWALPEPHLVYTPEVVAKATELLEKASAAADNLTQKARITQEQSIWSGTEKLIAKARGEQLTIFNVTLDGRTMPWRRSAVDEATIRSLFGVNDGVPLFAVEPDGRTQAVRDGEQFDLTKGITFSTKTP